MIESRPGVEPTELAKDLLARIDRAGDYTRTRKREFRRRSTLVKVGSLGLSAGSTIILGFQDFNPWTAAGFVMVALVTVINSLEPFFAWRSRWVLMEEASYRFRRLRDDLSYRLAATPADELDPAALRAVFTEYQQIWDLLSTRWLESRRAAGAG